MSITKKVYNVSYSNSGGAGQVAAELNKELINTLDIESIHLYSITGNLRQFKISKLVPQISAVLDKLLVSNNIRNTLFSYFRATNRGLLEEKISKLNECVLIIHWFPGCLRYKNLVNTIHHTNKIILVLHDTEIFTGGCHFPGNCNNYKLKCAKCPQVRKLFQDSIANNFNLKASSFSNMNNLVIVSPSQWLLDMAKASSMFSNATYFRIPNLISDKYSDYTPNQNDKLKNKEKGFRIGFIASNVNDKRKGLDLLISATNNKELKSLGVTLEVVGQKNIVKNRNTGSVIYRGVISDKSRLIEFLSNLDLLVVPSYQDNFPTVILEAKAVGVPVLARAVGGITEMIEDHKTGILFERDNEFLEKLTSTLNHSFLTEIGKNARKSFLRENSTEEVMKQWNTILN
jgi:glycosyltransferase involved in cell wall biosynthesis